MTVLVPYVPGMLHERTQAWAHSVGGACPAIMPGADEAYYWQLHKEWRLHDRDGGDLVVVEQDIVPADGVVEDMLACPEPWCVSPYPIANGTILDEGLGCTKFGVQLKRRHPDLMERVGEIDDDGMPAKDWHRLDVRIARVMRELGYAPHQHAASEHLHDYARRP